MLRYFWLICIVLLSAGCASTVGIDGMAVADAKENAGKEDIICKRELVSGSNIPQVVCRSLAQIEYERERARNSLHRAQIDPAFKEARKR